VLEAMAAGVPVVAADRTSLPEVVGDAGLVVDAEDPEAWAAGLESALGPDRDRLVRIGLLREAQFRWTTAAARVAPLLRAAQPGRRMV
jgi:glycosyltransferase involved in cell wall biosynthesis